MSQPSEVEGMETNDHDTEQEIQLLVPYSGKQGQQLLSKMKKELKRTLRDNIKITISYKITKLSTKIPAKNKTDFQHRPTVVYYGKCPSEGCKDDYVRETKRCTVERIKEHNGKGNNSHLLKHARKNGHTHVWEKDFQILGNNYQSNFKRKISESLRIRQLKPTLNVNEKSITLHLFN